MTKPDLDGAYALETPEDSLKLYSDWAETYDDSFAAASGYQLPEAVAETFARADGKGPVLDVGAGTGLVGVALNALGVAPIDGTDISSAMLAEAAMKDCYENLFEGDLTGVLDVEDGTYQGVVSAGTFTHGHVGPEAFDELLRVSAPGALFALTINAEHFEARGFATKFDALSNQVQGLFLHETIIYDGTRDDGHAEDKAVIAVFKKA
ncbi:methyltransferase domain-containing protein [uncultured Litoreibacter sp.]|uniref:class I SAM-dependent DNA methyltransferase n=1 Tax=uncultured Litoreibacter sp. TaxID=1392394 RepID=UPI00261CA011|nr:methyltransferase domain-containing protein [uncultured Litoreibacter sp.]